jgi:hypothetical protein
MPLTIEPTRLLTRATNADGTPGDWYWISLASDSGTVWLGDFTLEPSPPANANPHFLLLADNTLAYRVQLNATTDHEGTATFYFTFHQQSDDGTALFVLVLRLGSANIGTVLRMIDDTPLLFSDLYNGSISASRGYARGRIEESAYDQRSTMPWVPIQNFPILPIGRP